MDLAGQPLFLCDDTSPIHFPPVPKVVILFPADANSCAYTFKDRLLQGASHPHFEEYTQTCLTSDKTSIDGPIADELSCFISTFNNAPNLPSPVDTDTGGRGPWIAYRPKIDNTLYSCGHYMLFCEKNNPDAYTRSFFNPPNFRGYDNHCFFKTVSGKSFAICLTKDNKEPHPRKILDVVFPFQGPVEGDNAGGIDNQWHLGYRMNQIMEIQGSNLRPTLDPKAVGQRKCFMAPAVPGMLAKDSNMDQQSNQPYSLFCTNALGDMTNLPPPNWRGSDNLCYWEVKDEMSAFPSKDLAHPGTFVTCVVFEN